jgi:NAD(P)H dehydrogenase (quinone)
MSKFFLISAHPDPRSFNASIITTIESSIEESGHEFTHTDLYRYGFDPVLTESELHSQMVPKYVRLEQDKVLSADVIVLIFPIWWWGPPAILKGWMERVLRVDFAFRFDISKGRYVGMLSGRSAIIITTSGSDPKYYPFAWQRESHKEFAKEFLATCDIITIKQFHFHEISQYSESDILKSHLNSVHEYLLSDFTSSASNG